MAFERRADAERDQGNAELDAALNQSHDIFGRMREHDRVRQHRRIGRLVAAVMLAHRVRERETVAEMRAQGGGEGLRQRRTQSGQSDGSIYVVLAKSRTGAERQPFGSAGHHPRDSGTTAPVHDDGRRCKLCAASGVAPRSRDKIYTRAASAASSASQNGAVRANPKVENTIAAVASASTVSL